MCTVSYLPLKSGFILTSNRDEAPDRHAVRVNEIKWENKRIIYPRDPHAGGTWFAISDRGEAVCLLNGAYEPFVADPRYTHSRGLVVLDAFQHKSAEDFMARYDLSRTAPFTLLVVRNHHVGQVIWDGRDAQHTQLDPDKTHFWSSVTLYPKHVRKWRKSLFEQWSTAHPTPTQNSIIDFHCYGGKGDAENDFVMNRDDRVRTLSISSVERRPDKWTFHYLDLKDDANNHTQILDIDTGVATNT